MDGIERIRFARGLIVDPVVVVPVEGLSPVVWGAVLEQAGEVAVHACVFGDPECLYVVSRADLVDEMDCCVVCADRVMGSPGLSGGCG